ncbi:DUF2256 domain-containing protein [Candidatus Synechococcus calcipolaris G9]|uniref:DUF2256 domain-containing protein n=1 Tax=Candidatus Synechococcus calcipolaris G9 TaxID=1497997 RepID=A0ABT6F332_9SYNE|nr:DUF2256 domain-containing protein [Candidatus Synechococcus calcipolaris]MDG2992274.1 DUF2256 domain-containing protein [Candidatus Synechococcus calcipolaris G9]
MHRRKSSSLAIKKHLPAKVCPICNRPFEWRKKWADCWQDVKYCSQRCRRRRHLLNTAAEELSANRSNL